MVRADDPLAGAVSGDVSALPGADADAVPAGTVALATGYGATAGAEVGTAAPTWLAVVTALTAGAEVAPVASGALPADAEIPGADEMSTEPQGSTWR